MASPDIGFHSEIGITQVATKRETTFDGSHSALLMLEKASKAYKQITGQKCDEAMLARSATRPASRPLARSVTPHS